MSDNTATVAPQDDAAEWYNSQRDSAIRQVDEALNDLSTRHSQLENQWNELEKNDNLDYGTPREARDIILQQARIENEAAQIKGHWSTLQAERQRLETHTDPAYEELVANSSPKSQLFLRVHRSRLEGDPARLRQLMYADARCKAVGLRPDSSQYFSALEAAVGLDASDRNLDDFSELSDESDEMRTAKNATKRDEAKRSDVQLTPEQAGIAKDLGITSDEYAASMKNPFSQASVAIGDESNASAPIEVKFEQEKRGPSRAVDPAKYKPGAQSMTLSPAMVKFCEESGIDPKEYVRNKLAVDSGKTSHQWYEQRLKSQGLA